MKINDFQCGYTISRPKRIIIIVDHYGVDRFPQKRLLEVGAGFGDIGAEFSRTYGANVLCTDGRPEYVEMIRQKHPHVEAAVQDLEQPWPFKEKFDFILYMGVLHHIRSDHVVTTLEEAFNSSDNIVVEHEVTDSEDPHLIIPLVEKGSDQSIYQMGCRPTTAYMERVFMELGMKFERCMDDRINGPAQFTWEPGHAPAIGARRFWFVWK